MLAGPKRRVYSEHDIHAAYHTRATCILGEAIVVRKKHTSLTTLHE